MKRREIKTRNKQKEELMGLHLHRDLTVDVVNRHGASMASMDVGVLATDWHGFATSKAKRW